MSTQTKRYLTVKKTINRQSKKISVEAVLTFIFTEYNDTLKGYNYFGCLTCQNNKCFVILSSVNCLYSI